MDFWDVLFSQENVELPPERKGAQTFEFTPPPPPQPDIARHVPVLFILFLMQDPTEKHVYVCDVGILDKYNYYIILKGVKFARLHVSSHSCGTHGTPDPPNSHSWLCTISRVNGLSDLVYERNLS